MWHFGSSPESNFIIFSSHSLLEELISILNGSSLVGTALANTISMQSLSKHKEAVRMNIQTKKYESASHSELNYPPRLQKPRSYILRRACSLCGNKFKANGRYILYCDTCRKSDDVLKFSDWLPEYDENVSNVA